MVGHDGELTVPIEVGRRAVYIAKKLWPSLRFLEEGSERDRGGSDMVLKNSDATVQVKGDHRIAESGNLYVEVYEKTKGKDSQKWRHSPIAPNVMAYIFITDGIAVWVSVDVLARASVGRSLTQISATSIGILLSLATVEPKVVKTHNLWGTKVLI